MKQLSIIIPLLNEEESLEELYSWIANVVQARGLSYEIIFVDDGSKDQSWEVIKKLNEKDKNVKAIRFRRNFGKSQALNAGFKQAKGEVIITMDADLQDSPDEIPTLYQMIIDEKWDLVSGWKKKRYDHKLTKNLPSKLFNWAARKTSGLQLHDFNCGLKAYHSSVIKNIDVHGEMHRYIPVLAKNAGFERITEKVVQHQARKYGKTKFGLNRFINGFLDLLTISFISRFGKQPMHLFGALGVLMFFIGLCFATYMGIDKLFINPYNRLITNRPEFYIALATMIIGTQFFLAGFLGEIILRTKEKEKRYKIKEKI
ncbi:glycosyltransferase family 2 protein [Capnocytophaga catalasegens]|uniref:Glycosyl transferase family 2 n=1 Tax=Capnocytophaga catalasegens TaxID=1004260 RepID=A0AAV5AW81_9FLAO|nr:glycosyltransferase family 2 protein [Capnocytophaga catalasegens]GIZ14597.1 glycosyl transferase family 2 [Capnocytophaga catalasegens]GJM50799.1 glycosyl transferase family 2 [Capnocytophaga catalasegens]GJM51952.1 glycosyl transferase family 2 [Capnocytophaga catalasegens]